MASSLPVSPAFKILSVIGTRPEAIKMTPVIRALASHHSLDQQVLLTGQHDQLAKYFPNIPVQKLGMNIREHSVAELREALTYSLSHYMLHTRPDLVIVQGDTTSALAGAIAAKECGIPLAHVEAGLRSHDFEPWPEEENRVAIDAIAALLFAPTPAAAANLAAEAAVTGTVHVTGNSGIDALFDAGGLIKPGPLSKARRTIIVTCHRRENRGKALSRICSAIKRLTREFPVNVTFILHPNDHVRAGIESRLGGRDHINLIEPVTYVEMVRLMQSCWIILTDSGGLQEEGPALGKPVLVLRDVTERVEAPANVELVGTHATGIVRAVHRLLMDDTHYARMAEPSLAFGDGQAGPRTAALIENWLKKNAEKE